MIITSGNIEMLHLEDNEVKLMLTALLLTYGDWEEPDASKVANLYHKIKQYYERKK